jgi:hypothetical protein
MKVKSRIPIPVGVSTKDTSGGCGMFLLFGSWHFGTEDGSTDPRIRTSWLTELVPDPALFVSDPENNYFIIIFAYYFLKGTFI